MNETTANGDKFLAMVTAKANVTLPLSEFEPKSMLATPAHTIERAKFPAIDYHNHLDAQDPRAVLETLDACGIERTVNITMKTGAEALAMIERFHTAPSIRKTWPMSRACWNNIPMSGSISAHESRSLVVNRIRPAIFSCASPTALSSERTWFPRSGCIAYTSVFLRPQMSTSTIPPMLRGKVAGIYTGSIFQTMS